MTILYDAGQLVGWRGMPKLFLRWRGTIFHATLTTPMFWIVNSVYWALVLIPLFLNRQGHSVYGDAYVPVAFPELDWSVSTASMALLFFFIVFYNNNSYQRFYLLYSHCVGLGGTTMEWIGLVRTCLPPDRVSRWNATRLFLAAAQILYYSLHGEDFDEDEWQVIIDRCLLTPAEVASLKRYAGFKPFLAITWALEEVQAQVKEQTRTDGSLHHDLGQTIREELIHEQFREVAFKQRGHCGQIINMLKEPVPFPYFHLLNLMLLIQLSVTAYALAAKTSWPIGGIMMVIISLVLLGMRGLAVQLSNPFGDDSVDFNIETFMKGSYTNAVEYLKEGGHEPSLGSMPDAHMKNPLFSKTDPLGFRDEASRVAWAKPNSKTRKLVLGIGNKRGSLNREVRAEISPPDDRAQAAVTPPRQNL